PRLLHDFPDRSAVEKVSVRCLVVVKRLGPELISQAEQLLLIFIPQGKRKHAVHVIRHLIPPCLICTDEDPLLPFFSCKRKRNLKPFAQLFPVTDMTPVLFYCYHKYSSCFFIFHKIFH